MITLYYADFTDLDEEKLLTVYQGRVDKERLEKVMRTKSRKAKVRSLLAGYLLQLSVWERKSKAGEVFETIPLSYRYTEQGKPYLVNYPDIFFSLSHSGTLAVCAVSEEEIGVDVQEAVQIKKSIAERFFTREECELLQKTAAGGKEYEQLFFRMWSIKESYIKYTGLGMKQGLHTFSIDWEKQEIYENENGEKKINQPCAFFQEIILKEKPDYTVSICSKRKAEGIALRKVEL